MAVPVASPKRQPSPPDPHPRAHIYTMETTGLLVIALLLLILTLIRYWHSIPWSWR